MDPQQQQQLAGMVTSMGIAFLLFGLLVYVFLVFLFWRIFVKAGMAGPLSLLVLVPGIGPLIALCILAFGNWRAVPLGGMYASGLPSYPPPAHPSANHPPAIHPPSEPPTL